MYEYIIDAGERYEDWMSSSIFSTELFSREEFEEIIKKAIEKIESEDWKADWCSVAAEIIKSDKRFFVPETKCIAIVKNDGSFEGVR